VLSAQLVLAHIGGTPNRRATLKQLLRELNVRGGERQALRSLLAGLVQERRLLERHHVFELVPAPKAAPKAAARAGSQPARAAAPASAAKYDVRGRIHLHRDGYGFVTPEPAARAERSALPGDIFIPPPATGGALPGDLVGVRLKRQALPGDTRAEGAVVAILERRHATLVGTYRHAPLGDYVTPFDDRIRERVAIPAGAALPPAHPGQHRTGGASAAAPSDAAALDGWVVDVELTRFPAAGVSAQGRVIEILGRRDDFGVDVEIMIRKHYLPHRFPDAVLEQARALPATVPETDKAGRRDFRSLPIVTIDGESARDFDDAVHVTRLGHGHFALQVHIADVSAYVTPGSAIDAEARLRGTSVYFPDRAVPMLPAELSSGLCSLLPHQDRLVMSCLMEIDAHGEVVKHELMPGVIRSAARMTYTQVNAVLTGDAAARAQFAALAPQFELMAELQAALYGQRQRRGSIDFDLPQPEIDFDEQGLMRSIVKSERNIAHRLIEEFMLAAAETVARHIEAAGWASVYRIHEPPDVKKIAEFEAIAARFGYSLGLGPLPIQRMRVGGGTQRRGRAPRRGATVEVPQPAKFKISPRNYQKLAAQIAGKPEERMLSFLMLRSLKQARYSANNEGHFALATACYTHFTSPIRRYPDLMLHRILKALLAGMKPPPELAAAPLLEPLCRDASVAERRAEDAERELMEWKKVRFMEPRLGEIFDALIIHVTRQGLFVELDGLFIEGFIPASSLDDDVYHFRDATQEWVGERKKRRFRLGATMAVLADRIDPVRQQIHFAPAQ
jgi:ribonuclease R